MQAEKTMEATLQVRMKSSLKREGEELYRSLGTSLAEAVRMFIAESVREGGMPFEIRLRPMRRPVGGPSLRGIFAACASPARRALEKDAWATAASEKEARRLAYASAS